MLLKSLVQIAADTGSAGCGPNGETCLMDCANCQREIGQEVWCEDRWALTFDVSYQYPNGPVCDWPANVECSRCPNLPCAPIED